VRESIKQAFHEITVLVHRRAKLHQVLSHLLYLGAENFSRDGRISAGLSVTPTACILPPRAASGHFDDFVLLKLESLPGQLPAPM